MNMSGLGAFDLNPVLEVLGVVGLIMIVLEAAMDLFTGGSYPGNGRRESRMKILGTVKPGIKTPVYQLLTG